MYLQLVLTVALFVTSGVVQGQIYRTGGCPTYQTSDQFTQEKVRNLVFEGGIIPYLSSGTSYETLQSCQFLKFVNDHVFSYSYKDEADELHTVNGNYIAVPTTYKQPGFIRLRTGVHGILGSDSSGYVNLKPIFIDDDKEVYFACSSYGLFHAEYAYTFMRPGARLSGDVRDIKADLIKRHIPLAEEMTSNDLTCFVTDIRMQSKVPQFIDNLRTGGYGFGNDINIKQRFDLKLDNVDDHQYYNEDHNNIEDHHHGEDEHYGEAESQLDSGFIAFLYRLKEQAYEKFSY